MKNGRTKTLVKTIEINEIIVDVRHMFRNKGDNALQRQIDLFFLFSCEDLSDGWIQSLEISKYTDLRFFFQGWRQIR